ncbi:MAG: hypothetical protein J5510_07925, partial [Prevotella sp.]|nr:hypothetical protein [Prevotella sp.]
MAEKLRRMSKVRPQGDMDSVERSKSDRGRAFNILMEAQQYWDSMARFRRDRERCKRYTYGEQWKDM